MRKMKHQREAIKAKREAANTSYQDARANGTLETTAYSVLGGANGVNRVNMGYRMSPDLKQGYRFRNPMNAKGARNKRGTDSILNVVPYTDKDGSVKQFKFYTQGKTSVTDSELYESQPKAHKERGEARVRIGTTPSRGIFLTDKVTGEEKYVRLKPKAKWQDVGLPSCNPKDGGK